ncbi:glycosyl transferase [Tardibacter chloracetimidivorans]|uniref:Glycosyl transferase n=2 Tax=Tardibacter chloracetimidivorans TaxID=1921510 RepID=A0A1L4A001_9SPHN|nr:glycosyl transferase [Tardibacter chloracetimidivorans]
MVKISLITATYNAADTVADSLRSAAMQTYQNVEHIVIDGASTDGTQKIVEESGERLTTFVSEPDRGIYDALNKGIALATGDVIGFLHADDLFAHQEVLLRVASTFQDPDVDVSYGDLEYVRRTDPDRVVRRWISGTFAPGRLAYGWMPPHPTFYVRRQMYDRFGLFDLDYKISADYDQMLRLLRQQETTVRYIPETLIQMRLGGASNQSLQSILLKSSEDYRIIQRHKLIGFLTLLGKNLSKVRQFRPF